jgi:hypothetical protein
VKINKVPNSSSTKQATRDWLQKKGIPFSYETTCGADVAFFPVDTGAASREATGGDEAEVNKGSVSLYTFSVWWLGTGKR